MSLSTYLCKLYVFILFFYRVILGALKSMYMSVDLCILHFFSMHVHVYCYACICAHTYVWCMGNLVLRNLALRSTISLSVRYITSGWWWDCIPAVGIDGHCSTIRQWWYTYRKLWYVYVVFVCLSIIDNLFDYLIYMRITFIFLNIFLEKFLFTYKSNYGSNDRVVIEVMIE